jgi:hypothetical protein
LSTHSANISQKDTNHDKADVSLYKDSSPTHKEQTQNIDIMNNVEDMKFTGSNAMSGTLATVKKFNARYVGTIRCTSFTAYGATQKISTWKKCICEQFLNHKTSIEIPCHWNCVFLGSEG